MSTTLSSSGAYDSGPLLGPGDPAPVTVLNPGGAAKCILMCDHAAVAVPARLNNLGLDTADFSCHWAVDVGARMVTEHLSRLLDAPAILANYSRAVVDLNRPLDHPTAFVTSGEGKPIPGNIGMTEHDRSCRIAELYNPYHDRLGAMIDDFLGRGVPPVLLAIHSFTPVFFKHKRPWEFGVMWAQDRRVATPMIDYFRGLGFTVGDNEPYDARVVAGTSILRHGDDRNLPNVQIEIRNDQIRNDQNAAKWAEMLNNFMRQILADETIHTLYDGPVLQYDRDHAQKYFENLNLKAQQDDWAKE